MRNALIATQSTNIPYDSLTKRSSLLVTQNLFLTKRRVTMLLQITERN